MSVISVAGEDLKNYQTNGIRIGFIKSKSGLAECHITDGFPEVPSTAQEIFDACSMPGFYEDLAVNVYDLLHIPRDKMYLLPMPDQNYGSFVNGSWQGLLGILSRKGVDSTSAEVIPTSERLKIADFSASIYSTETVFLTR